jgi:ubiquinone/menaquinone biosynthesis C-methylase UbiE/uncharacterized protein YbaR (Trm112 family)
MKHSTLEILACPACLAFPLTMNAAGRDNESVKEGSLFCSSCQREYPIIRGIPRLLTDARSLSPEHIEIRDANILYHDAAAETYEHDVEESIHQSPYNQRRMNDVVEGLARRTANGCFLDVGCGTGNLLKFGHRHFRSAVGTDVSVNMLKTAQDRGYEVLQADASCLPFRPEVFNVVSIFSVLHHLFDYERFLAEAARVLRPQGYLYTDWDPQKRVEVDPSRLSWQVYQWFKRLTIPLRWIGRRLSPSRPINLREIRPDLKHLYEKAEYRNLALRGEERGIDYDCLRESLIRSGFINIQPTFHWSGRSAGDLPVNLRVRLLLMRLQGHTIERAMENLMVIAEKDTRESCLQSREALNTGTLAGDSVRGIPTGR